MSQEILNKKNIAALAESEKKARDRLKTLEEEMVGLKRLVTSLTVEVQSLRSQVDIQKVIGATSGNIN